MPRLRTDAAFAIAHHPHACLAAFCCGVVALRFWAALPAVQIAVAAAIVMLVVAVRSASWRLPAAFVIGFCWANVTASAVLARELPAALEKRDVQVIGRIVGAPALGSSVQRFEFEVAQLHYKGKRYPSPGRITIKMVCTGAADSKRRALATQRSIKKTARLSKPRRDLRPRDAFIRPPNPRKRLCAQSSAAEIIARPRRIARCLARAHRRIHPHLNCRRSTPPD